MIRDYVTLGADIEGIIADEWFSYPLSRTEERVVRSVADRILVRVRRSEVPPSRTGWLAALLFFVAFFVMVMASAVGVL